MSMPYNCPMKRVKLFENLLGKCGWNNQQTIEFHPSPSLIQSHHFYVTPTPTLVALTGSNQAQDML